MALKSEIGILVEIDVDEKAQGALYWRAGWQLAIWRGNERSQQGDPSQG